MAEGMGFPTRIRSLDKLLIPSSTENVMAEGMGFEPTVRTSRTHAFQACSFGHSDTLPK